MASARQEYAPPEQYDPGVHTDQRSDIYALGATLYHLLTGQAPVSVTRRTVEPAAFKLPRQTKAEISPEVEQVILRAMEIERAKRFATAADMRAALNLIRQPYLFDATRTTNLAAVEVSAGPRSAPSRPERRWRALVMVGVPLLLLLGALFGIAFQANSSTVAVGFYRNANRSHRSRLLLLRLLQRPRQPTRRLTHRLSQRQ